MSHKRNNCLSRGAAGSLPRRVPHPAAAARLYTIRCFGYFLVPAADFSIWEVKGYPSPTSTDGLTGSVTVFCGSLPLRLRFSRTRRVRPNSIQGSPCVERWKPSLGPQQVPKHNLCDIAEAQVLALKLRLSFATDQAEVPLPPSPKEGNEP